MNCAFCELKEIKRRMIAETKLSWAFPTNIPITIGHTLVLPKRCVARINDLTLEELNDIFHLLNTIKFALEKTFEAKGFNCAWNEGDIAGQSVPHLHIHVVPRKPGDEGIYEYDPRKFLYRPGNRAETPNDELIEVSRMISQNIG